MTHVLCALFFLSGAAALLFETLWFHQAGLTFGNSVWGSAIVLSSFMAGLALGNGAMARYGGRVRRPVRFYAGLEAVIAVTGVALVYLLPLLSEGLAPVFRPFLDRPLLINPLRLGAGFLLLLPPATAMGATLPVLVKVLLSRDPNFGSVLGRLYGWNTLGAVFGAVAGEAALIEWFGIRGTSLVAAALNAMAVAVALVLAARVQPAGEARFAETDSHRAPLSTAARRLLAAALLAGAILLAFEVVWFRFMHLFVHSGGLVFSLMLATVLAGIAFGGFAGGLWQRRFPAAFENAAGLTLVSGGLSVALYAGFRGVIAPYTEVLIADPLSVLWLSFCLMFPLAFASGILFTFIGAALHRELAPETRATGWLTLANTIGGAIGSMLAGFVLLPIFGMERSFFALGAAYGVVALLLWPPRARASRGRLRPVLAACFVAATVLFPFGLMDSEYLRISIGRWDKKNQLEIAAVREGRIETIVYLRKALDGETIFYQLLTNGFSMSSTSTQGRRYQRLYVFWPVALKPDPKRALVISCGAGSTARGLVETESLEHIDVVDISQEIIDLADLVYPDPADHPLHDPRVHVHIEDGRYFLQTTDQKYDLITADPPPPKNAGVVNLYTREYFQLMYDRLNEGGIATYWLPAHNTLESDTKAILRGFCDVFSDCSLWAGWDMDWMMAGSRNASFAQSEEAFARSWHDPKLAAELRGMGIEKPEQMGAMFMADADQLRELLGDAPPLIDDRPKRLSNARHAPHRARRVYRDWIDADLTRARFESSEFIRRAWPPSLRERTLPYFEFQGMINDIATRKRFGLRQWVERLHEILTQSDLETLVLWHLGDMTDRQLAVDRLLAQGKPEFRYRRSLAIRAFADRDYERASELLFTPPAKPQRDANLIYLRIYALCMAGKVEQAQALAATVAGWLPPSDAQTDYYAWLAETFGFDPTAASTVSPERPSA